MLRVARFRSVLPFHERAHTAAMLKRRRVWFAVALVVLLMLPFVVAHLRNESAIGDGRDQIEASLGKSASLLKADWSVESRDDSCIALVAVAVATEKKPTQLAAQLREGGLSVGVAWSQPGKHVAETPEGHRIRELPATVRKLLDLWMVMPDGVRRVVVYRYATLSHSWDPRCF